MSEEVVVALREQVDKLSLMVEGQQQAFIHVLNALNNVNARTEQLENGVKLLCSTFSSYNESKQIKAVLSKDSVTDEVPYLDDMTKFKQLPDGKWIKLKENEFYNGVAGCLYTGRGVSFITNIRNPTLEDKKAILHLKWVTQYAKDNNQSTSTDKDN